MSRTKVGLCVQCHRVISSHAAVCAEDAVKEAKDPQKVPIALVDGPTLVQSLLDHEIGVEHVNVY